MSSYTGLVHGLSEEAYRAAEGVNYSEVKRCLKHKTPAHYHALCLHPGRPAKLMVQKEDQAMVNGKAMHSLVLEPESFDSLYLPAVSDDKRTKKYRDQAEANPSKTLLRSSDWDEVHRMAESVKKHPGASWLLSEGRPEVSMFWNDQKSGEGCKGRNDWLRSDHHIVDLKSTYDASFNRYGFRYIVEVQLHYSWQMAHYCNGYEAITGKKPAFTFIAVENDYPFFTHVINYPERKIQKFKEEFREKLDRYLWAKNNNWPGYSDFIEEA